MSSNAWTRQPSQAANTSVAKPCRLCSRRATASHSRRSSLNASAVLQKPPASTNRSSISKPADVSQPADFSKPSDVSQPSQPVYTPEPDAVDYVKLISQLEQDASSFAARRATPINSVRTDTVWHFAYGANMNFYTLAKRGVRVVSRDSAFVRDERVHMVFKHRGGYATLQRMDDGQLPMLRRYTKHAHGVLYQITKEDMKKLEAKEGGYMLKEFEVETYDGRVVRAVAFVSGPMSLLPQEVAPTERYMMVLRDGAGDNYLEPLHQAFLSAIPTVPSVGLPAHYYDTPSKYLAYGFVASCACLLLSFHIHLA